MEYLVMYFIHRQELLVKLQESDIKSLKPYLKVCNTLLHLYVLLSYPEI